MVDNELFGISEQLNDLISRRAAVDAKNIVHIEMFGRDFPVVPVETLKVLPPVDAVPVVRCKDCRFSDWYTAVDGKRYCYCMEHDSSGHQGMDFCSYGEKDGDGNGV